MAKKNSYLTVTDQFCGAGGSSLGVKRLATKMGGGVEVRLAMNHWKLAIKTHAHNFPDADHDCADISNTDPRRYRSTDILITSPECTNHSLTSGRKRNSEKTAKKNGQLYLFGDEAERSRATMWDVPRFAEYHNYNIIIVENVIDAKKWIPYEAWLKAMDTLGYTYKEVFLNSMHFFPTPQSRDRMYIVFWKKKNKAPDLEYYPIAWCTHCNKNTYAKQSWKKPTKATKEVWPWGKYRSQYNYCCVDCYSMVEPYYYAAFNCIDWSIKSERIGDRSKPLSPNTIRRIEFGIEKYWNNPFLIYGGDKDNKNRSYNLGGPIPTQCAQPWHSLISPFVTYLDHSKSELENRVHSSIEEMKTQTTTQNGAIVMPPFPFLSTGAFDKTSNVFQGIPTQTSQQSWDFVQPPFLMQNYSRKSSVGNIEGPMSCQVGTPHDCIITDESWQAFMGYYYGSGEQTSHITEAIDTCTTRDRAHLQYFKSSERVKAEDCYYRMIRAHEVGKAMAFPTEYLVFGNERQKVKQYGNAVTPPVMEWLVEKCIESLK